MPDPDALSPTDPAVRASHLKEDVAALSTLGHDLESRVRARVATRTLRVIEDATRVDWLPLELNVELAEAVFQEAGDARTRAWASASFGLSLNAFFKPLMESALRLFDPTPHRIYGFLPRAWPTVYRNSGSVSVEEEGPSATRIVASQLPFTLMNEAFLRAVAGTWEYGYALTKLRGEVQLLPFEPRSRTATWIASWNPKR